MLENHSQQWLHLYDGTARVEGDRLMGVVGEANPMFWGCEERRDWLFGVDVREWGEGEIPALPGMPPDGARVYGEGKRQGAKL